MLVLEKEETAGEAFNIGTGMATKMNQLASVLLEITKKAHLKLNHSKPREGDIKHSIADISKARRGYIIIQRFL
jgi:UDP-glucose 4-epimerase